MIRSSLTAANAWLLRRLARITSSGRFVPEIDGLRFFAIASVVGFHLNGYILARAPAHIAQPAALNPLSLFFAHGDLGVRLFYVLSGFILAVPFAEHHLSGRPTVPLGKYFLRRVTRLEPPYIANLLFCAAALALVDPGRGALLPHLLASIGYVHNIVYAAPSTINPVAWSLEVEIQWYILAPFVCSLLAIRNRAGRRAVLVGAIVVCAAVASQLDVETWPRFGRSIGGYGHFFLAGILLAEIYLLDWSKPSARPLAWDAAGLVGWIALWPLETNASARPFVVAAVLLAYVGSFRGRWLNRVVSSPWIATIGGMCYTIYLYHTAVISAVGRFSIRWVLPGWYGWTVLVQVVVVGTALFLVSGVAFALLEKPFMVRNWPSKTLARILARG